LKPALVRATIVRMYEQEKLRAWKKVISQIAEKTEENDHSGAVFLLAEALGVGVVEARQLIKDHRRAGHLTSDLRIRQDILRDLLLQVAGVYAIDDEKTYDTLYRAF